MTRFVLRSDGGARGNPGPAAAGFVLEDAAGVPVTSGGRYIGEATNNVAEYDAVAWGLECALAAGATEVEILADSELVVKQLNGVYKVKHANMRAQYVRVMGLLDKLGRWSVRHVRREENQAADALVNLALDTRGTVGDAASYEDAGRMRDTLF